MVNRRLKLENDYYIRTNKRSFILVKDTKRVSKEGEPILLSKGYYTKLSQALESYVDMMLLEGLSDFDMNLSGVKVKLEELRKELASYDVGSLVEVATKENVEIIDDDNEEDA